jgi:hypothetical protein
MIWNLPALIGWWRSALTSLATGGARAAYQLPPPDVTRYFYSGSEGIVKLLNEWIHSGGLTAIIAVKKFIHVPRKLPRWQLYFQD